MPKYTGSGCIGSNVWTASLPQAATVDVSSLRLQSDVRGCQHNEEHPEQCNECSGRVCALRSPSQWELDICNYWCPLNIFLCQIILVLAADKPPFKRLQRLSAKNSAPHTT